MGALNLPSATDVERLTRRVRSVSQRLEGIEDGVDRLDRRLAEVSATAGLDERLEAIERSLEAIAAEVGKLSKKPASRSSRAASGSRAASRSKPAADAEPDAAADAKPDAAVDAGSDGPPAPASADVTPE